MNKTNQIKLHNNMSVRLSPSKYNSLMKLIIYTSPHKQIELVYCKIVWFSPKNLMFKIVVYYTFWSIDMNEENRSKCWTPSALDPSNMWHRPLSQPAIQWKYSRTKEIIKSQFWSFNLKHSFNCQYYSNIISFWLSYWQGCEMQSDMLWHRKI